MPRDQDGLYRRPDSSYWWAVFTDGRGRQVRRSTQCTSKKEAKKLLTRWRHESHQYRFHGQQPERTFDQLLAAFLDVTDRDEAREIVSLRHLHPAFTGRVLHTITPVDIRSYTARRLEEGASASTVNKEIGLLSRAINYARSTWGWNIENPVQGCRIPEPEGWGSGGSHSRRHSGS